MAYIRRKRVGVYHYYQLVENRRIEGKPRQKVLAHLGRHDSIQGAMGAWEKESEELLERTRESYRRDQERAASDPEQLISDETLRMFVRGRKLQNKAKYLRDLIDSGEAQGIEDRFKSVQNKEDK